MTKKHKKKNPSEVTFLELMFIFKNQLKSFVDQPTDQNLKKIISVAQTYKDGWIKIAAKPEGFGNTKPSKFLTGAFVKDQGPLTAENEELDALPESEFAFATKPDSQHDFEQDGMFVELKKSFTKRYKAIKNTKIDRIIKTELGRATSPDKNTKVLTYSIYIPQGKYGDDQMTVNELDYIQHSIRSTRTSADPANPRLLNRRWYFEQSEGEDGKSAWWCDREEFSKLIENANDAKMFKKEFDDPRIDESNITYQWSDDLSDAETEELMKHFTLERERDELRQEGYFFCVAETQYPKALSQIASKGFHDNKCLWKDILIISPTKVTIRSATNDRYHRPSEKIPDSGWLISNDMTSLPNQIVRKFIPYINTRVMIND